MLAISFHFVQLFNPINIFDNINFAVFHESVRKLNIHIESGEHYYRYPAKYLNIELLNIHRLP